MVHNLSFTLDKSSGKFYFIVSIQASLVWTPNLGTSQLTWLSEPEKLIGVQADRTRLIIHAKRIDSPT